MAPTPASAPSGEAASAATALVERLLAGNAEDATAATMEALAWGGIATRADGGIVQAPVVPVSPLQITTFEVSGLAPDAASRADGVFRLTLADLATSLVQLGLELPEGTHPGQALVKVLALAIAEGDRQPGNPAYFAPAFLRAMSQATGGPDLAAGTADPADVRLSLLEAELLLAFHVERNAPAATARVGSASWLPSLGVRTAHAADPCSQFRDDLGGPTGDVAQFGLSQAAGDLWEKAVGSALDLAGSAAKKFATAIGVGFKVLQALVATTVDSVRFEIQAEPGKQHYTHFTDLDHRVASFVAKVEVVGKKSIPESGVESAMRDCLSFLDFSLPQSAEQLAQAMGDWNVTWEPLAGMPRHATFDGALKSDLTVSGMKAEGRVPVRLQDEPRRWTPEGNQNRDLRAGKVRVRATLDQAVMEKQTILKALAGRVLDTSIDVGALLLTKALSRTAEGTLTAEWHQPGAFALRITQTMQHPDFSGHGEALIPLTEGGDDTPSGQGTLTYRQELTNLPAGLPPQAAAILKQSARIETSVEVRVDGRRQDDSLVLEISTPEQTQTAQTGLDPGLAAAMGAVAGTDVPTSFTTSVDFTSYGAITLPAEEGASVTKSSSAGGATIDTTFTLEARE